MPEMIETVRTVAGRAFERIGGARNDVELESSLRSAVESLNDLGIFLTPPEAQRLRSDIVHQLNIARFELANSNLQQAVTRLRQQVQPLIGATAAAENARESLVVSLVSNKAIEVSNAIAALDDLRQKLTAAMSANDTQIDGAGIENAIMTVQARVAALVGRTPSG